MSFKSRLYLILAGLFVWGLISLGGWMGWHNLVALMFVLVVIIGISRSERNSKSRAYGWRRQK